MKAKPECLPCIINQVLNGMEKIKVPESKREEVVLKVINYLSSIKELRESPAYYASFPQRILKESLHLEDPFYEQKKLANRVALEIYPKVRGEVFSSKDPLERALELSAYANLIDFAVRKVSLEEIRRPEVKKGVWEYQEFKRDLKESKSVLILGDNAGEIVFDKVLVEVLRSLNKEVIYAVKGKPILNDATYEDAKEVSLTEVCKVIDNGSDMVGTLLRDCSKEFKEFYYGVDLVISKGQGNYETVEGRKRLYALLIAKCKVIAQDLNINKGEVALKKIF